MKQHEKDYIKLRKLIASLDWNDANQFWLPDTLDMGVPILRDTLIRLLQVSNREIRFLSLAVIEALQFSSIDIVDSVKGAIVSEALLATDRDIAVRAAHRVLSMGVTTLYSEMITESAEKPLGWPSELIDMCIELQRARENDK